MGCPAAFRRTREGEPERAGCRDALRRIFAIVTPGVCPGRGGRYARWGVPTFQESYCADGDCPDAHFVDRVLGRCLHWRARMLRPLLDLMQPDHFAPDRELVEQVGRVRGLAQLDQEIRDYVTDHRNASWVRGRAKIRISTRRLRMLARSYLSPMEKTRRG